MAGIIKFRLIKYTTGNTSKEVFNFKPRCRITLNKECIGHIIDKEVYFYIAVNYKENSSDGRGCLNYTPELWKKFSTHQEAKDTVIQSSEQIWKTLNIYHSLNKQS